MLLVQVPDRPGKGLLMMVLMILLMILLTILLTNLLKMQKMKNWIFVRMTLKLS